MVFIQSHTNAVATGNLQWSIETEGAIMSSPSVSQEGIIYFGSNDNKLRALNPDGTEKWSFLAQDWIDSSPSISGDGVLYFGSWDNHLYALRSVDGTKIWEFKTNSSITSTPSIGADGKIYFGSHDEFFYALNADGSLSWDYFAGNPISSSAVLGRDGTVYFGDEGGNFHALKPDGSLKWIYSTEQVGNAKNSILSSPAIDVTGNLLFGSGNGYCYSLSDQEYQARLNWKYLTGDRVDASPVIGLSGQVLFASRDGYLRSIDIMTGVNQWEILVGDVFYSSPVIDEHGRIYLVAYTGSGKNKLYCLNEDGNLVSSSDDSSYSIDGLVDTPLTLDAFGNLYFGSLDGKLYSIRIDTTPAKSDWPQFGRVQNKSGSWPSFQVTTKTSPEVAGLVEGSGIYNQGTTLTLKARSNLGYSFSSWSMDPSVKSDELSFEVTSPITVTAFFQLNKHTLSSSNLIGGKVSGTGIYTYGENAPISATPNQGYSFHGWTGSGIMNRESPITTVSMTMDRFVLPLFSLNSYELQVNATNGGSASGSGTYSFADRVPIQAKANEGSFFDKWFGDNIEDPFSSLTYLNIEKDQNVTASFSSNTHDLNLTAGIGGSVSGSGSYSFGSEVDVSAYPEYGYKFEMWFGDGVEDPNSSTTKVEILRDKTIFASFTPENHLLTINFESQKGDAGGTGLYEHRSMAPIFAFPKAGFVFSHWDGVGISDPQSPSTTVLVDQNKTISAIFSTNDENYKNLIIVAEPPSSGFTYGSGSYDQEQVVTISAIPADGFFFTEWIGNGVQEPNLETTTVKMIDDRNITAVFRPKSYNLSTSSFPEDSGVVMGEGIYEFGEEVEVSAESAEGYSFSYWSGDVSGNPTTSSTKIKISENLTLTAHFSINSHVLAIEEVKEGNSIGNGIYDFGTRARIEAIPKSGYNFTKWSGMGPADPNSAVTYVEMVADRMITPEFSPSSYELIINDAIGGTLNGDGIFGFEEKAPIVAFPSEGYTFVNWSGSGIEEPYRQSTFVSMDKDRNISAVFSINSYELKLFNDPGGNVEGQGNYPYGTQVQIIATPLEGYSFTGWSGSNIDDPSSYSTSINLTKDLNASANFTLNRYELDVQSSVGGFAIGDGIFAHGTMAFIEAIPNQGYFFQNWSGSSIQETDSISSFVEMKSHQTVTAHFSLKTYDLEVSVSGGGSVSGSGTYSYGSNPVISARPNFGSEFIGWTGSGINDPGALNTSVSMIQNRQISAVFSQRRLSDLSNTSILGPSWYQSWFGAFYQDSSLWYHHENFGWILTYQTEDEQIWFWTQEYGWLWTEEETFSQNYCWSDNFQSWILFNFQDIPPTYYSTRILSSLKVMRNLNNGWHQSWFGIFFQDSPTWSFHDHFGWIAPHLMDEKSLWFWSNHLGWLWTNEAAFFENYCWSDEIQDWVFFNFRSRPLRYYLNNQKVWLPFEKD